MSLLLALESGAGYTLTCQVGVYSLAGQQALINKSASVIGSGVVKRKPGKYEVYSFNKPVAPIKVANDDEYVLLFLM